MIEQDQDKIVQREGQNWLNVAHAYDVSGFLRPESLILAGKQVRLAHVQLQIRDP